MKILFWNFETQEEKALKEQVKSLVFRNDVFLEALKQGGHVVITESHTRLENVTFGKGQSVIVTPGALDVILSGCRWL